MKGLDLLIGVFIFVMLASLVVAAFTFTAVWLTDIFRPRKKL